MAKGTGMGAALWAGGYDIGGDTQSFDLHGGNTPLDLTDITESAHERAGGQRSAEIAWVSYFDLTGAHVPLSALPTADTLMTAVLPPVAIGAAACSQVSKLVGYDPTRDQQGNLTLAIDAQSSAYGQEWGTLLTAGKRTDTVATNGTSWDFGGASPSFGAQAYLQLFAFTGTDITIKLQDSANNSTFADVTGGAFTQITGGAPNWQRIATASNLQVREFVRVATVTTGGFTTCTFAVQISVNGVAVTF